PSSRMSAAGWKKPENPVGMWLRVATSVTVKPARPSNTCIARLLSQALKRLEHSQVEWVERERLLPGVPRQVLVAEPLVQRPLHRQDVLVVRVLPLELHQLDQRQLVVAR